MTGLLSNEASITRTALSSTLAVPLETVKKHLRVDDDGEDDILTTYIKAASDYVEQFTRYALMSTSYVQAQRFFKAQLILARYPVTSIASIQYYDRNGVKRTLDSGFYRFDANGAKPPVIVLNSATSNKWPETDGQIGSVQIAFTAGYTDPADIPPLVQRCIMEFAGYLFEQRQPVFIGQGYRMDVLPDGIRHLMHGARLTYDL
jgi:uncharacterized phiE125 gp8 family phage protein